MLQNKYENIFTQRHPDLKNREYIWKMIHNSYKGGMDYKKGGNERIINKKGKIISESYLWRYPRESVDSYEARKRRAVYFNQISPLADMLAGFLFKTPPMRNDINLVNYLLDKADIKGKSFDNLMRITTIHSLLFTCGILVDSPEFDDDEIRTEKDRLDMGLNPYCILYLPFSIRNFNFSKDGELQWIILDNSYYDNSNPLSQGTTRKIYRLWTKEYFRDFEKSNNKIIDGAEIPHNLGFVPFRFVNWRDDNNDFIAESVMEDPAMISQIIYNKMSEMDEMTAAGAIQCLFYPSETGEAPDELLAGGISNLSVIPYKGSFSPPAFQSGGLSDITPFFEMIRFYIAEIKHKLGLETDEEKNYVQSGYAKELDFKKVKALLASGADVMQSLEKWIFETAAAWENKKIVVDIKYNNSFNDAEILAEIQSLTELLIYPVDSLQKEIMKLIAGTLLSGKIDPDKIQEIRDEIDQKNIEEENNE